MTVDEMGKPHHPFSDRMRIASREIFLCPLQTSLFLRLCTWPSLERKKKIFHEAGRDEMAVAATHPSPVFVSGGGTNGTVVAFSD
jgi:hypothetical protein